MAGQILFEFTGQDKVTPVIDKIRNASQKLNQAFKGATTKVSGSFDKLKNSATSLQGVLGSLGAAAAVKGFAQAGIEADRTAKRMKFLGDQFGETARLQAFANEAAQKFTLGQTDAANAVSDLFGRLRPMGVSMGDIETVFNGVNVAAKQMSLSTADTEGVMLQLSQALGSGKLQGDEFRSIMERLPKIGQAVAKSMGVTVGELKELSSQGKLTTDVIIKALKDIEKQGFPKADGAAAFSKAMKDLSTAIGKKLTPVLNPILKGIAGLVQSFLSLPEPVQAAVIGFTAVAGAFAAIAPLLPIIAAGLAAVVGVITGPVGIVAAIGGAVAAFFAMKGKAEETKEPVTQVKNETEKLKAATEAAARAKQKFIERSRLAVQSLRSEQQQIKAQEAAFENALRVTDARLQAETAINQMQHNALQIAYENAGSAKERLGIAQKIYQNEVQGARLAYQQTINSIEAEKKRLEFRRQAAVLEGEMIRAKGELAAAEAAANGANQAQIDKILAKTQQAVDVQRQNVQLIDGQIAAQKQIGEFQKTAAEAQLKAKEQTAKQKLKQKLVSDEIGLSNEKANTLIGKISQSSTNANTLSTNTGKVATNASTAAGNFIRVATAADQAANSIMRAAQAQAALNRARASRGRGGGGGGDGGPVSQAKGGYNLGSFTPFAKGGVVKGPTLGLIGEGGEPEYIIPESKAAGFAANFLSGKRGISAVPGFADGGMAVPASASVSIQTGPVTQMGGQNYVTTADLGAAVEAGVLQTLDILRRDQATRASMGLS